MMSMSSMLGLVVTSEGKVQFDLVLLYSSLQTNLKILQSETSEHKNTYLGFLSALEP